MNYTITVSGFNRPYYLRQVLFALRRCYDIHKWKVAVLLDPCEQTEEQRVTADELGFPVYVHRQRMGCSKAILAAVSYGFEEMHSDFHLHLEDDTVPTRDALIWYDWALKEFQADENVFTVSGYQLGNNYQKGQAQLRYRFTCWGWGTWKSRFMDIKNNWDCIPDVSWDVAMYHGVRKDRAEVGPTVSRIQNIGALDGVHVPSADWHRRNHYVRRTADQTPGGVRRQFRLKPLN